MVVILVNVTRCCASGHASTKGNAAVVFLPDDQSLVRLILPCTAPDCQLSRSASTRYHCRMAA